MDSDRLLHFNRQNLAAVMLSDRNTSTLVRERGIAIPGRTSDLGMQAMIRAVMERTFRLKDVPELWRFATSP
jgi:hypothetical protein